QNIAYNQPPHPGFFLGHGMDPAPKPEIYTVDAVSEVDISALEELIDKAKAISNADELYTEESFEALQEAIGQAEESIALIDSEDALNSAIASLQEAIDQLVKVDQTPKFDLTELEELIDKAKAISNADESYTEESFEALQKAIEQAEESIALIDSEDALNSAITSLQEAIDQLVKVDQTPKFDLTELEELIDKAKAISNADESYTEESFEALQEAIQKVEQALETIDTEEALNIELNLLQAAIDGLELVKDNKEEPVEEDVNEDENEDIDGDNQQDSTIPGESLPKTASPIFNILAVGM